MLGWGLTLIRYLYDTNKGTARVYLIDNSRSMVSGAGHVIVNQRSTAVTAWMEAKAMIKFHAEFNAQLGCPALFGLLNPLGAKPVEVRSMRDTFGVHAMMARDPHGGTPLTERLEEMKPMITGLLKEVRRVVVVIVTDGEPDGDVEAFVKAIKSITALGHIDVVVRLCTDDDDVVGW